MMGRTHMMIGASAGLFIGGFINRSLEPLYIGGLLLGSIAPDIDHPKGFINSKFKWVYNGFSKTLFYSFLVIGCLVAYKLLGNRLCFAPIPFLVMVAISKHRGITHSLLGLALMYITSRYLGQYFSLHSLQPLYDGVLVGWALHMLADMFNPQGVELFYPCRKNFRLPVTIETNKSEEKAVQIVTGAFMLYQGFVAFI